MKSKLIYLMMIALATVSVVGCDDESTAGMTRITYYPELALEGATTLYLDKGAAFADPGYSASLNGEDVTDDVKVTSNVDTANSGVYSISYSITNADGFSSTASRTVIVTDPADAVEGVYDVDPTSYRLYNGSQVAFGGEYVVLILRNSDGTFAIDDFFAGWYAQRAGYDAAKYSMKGNMSVADNGDITVLNSLVQGWGDSVVSLTGKVDTAAQTITYDMEYVKSMHFFVTMYKR